MNRVHHWICGSGLWRAALERKIVPWVLESCDLGDNVLEIGPGPGLATELLRVRVPRLTSLEIDGGFAAALGARMRTRNVTVVNGDATAMPFPAASFSGAVSLTMLHHVPSAALQDRLFAEVFRVLRPGAFFAGSDSRASLGMTLIHIADTMVIVDPDTLRERLERTGFRQVSVEKIARSFRFSARK